MLPPEATDTLLGLSCKMQAQLMFDGRTLASNAMHSLPRCRDRLLRDVTALSQTISPPAAHLADTAQGCPRCGPGPFHRSYALILIVSMHITSHALASTPAA